MVQILLVEDDTALGRGIGLALETEQRTVRICGTVEQARKAIGEAVFDLVILDVNLPDGSGLALLRQCREMGSTPVILLTANDLETDIVTGLELGADDYITKPFSLAVLRARVNAQLRRNAPGRAAAVEIGPYRFDFAAMEFQRGGETVELSKTEQKLLRLLVENRGVTLRRGELVDRIWTDGAEYVEENALSVTVKRLRSKLGAESYIRTVYGIGYAWVTP